MRRSDDGGAGEGGPMKAANAGQAMAMVLVDELVRCGVRHACLSPGSRSTPLALALVAHPGLAVHMFIDERSSAFCALGIAKATGVPAVVACTSGTATANLFPAVVEADQSRAPLLVLTADRPAELRHTGANQTIDQLKLYGSTVRWFVEMGVPEARAGAVAFWRSTASRAWAEATGSPAGPVHLNLSLRDPLVAVPDQHGFGFPLEGRPDGAPWTSFSLGRALPRSGDLEALAEAVSATERGLVVAGAGPAAGAAGPAGSAAGRAAAQLARMAGWPLLADPLSGARLPGSISAYEALLRHPGFARTMAPDLVIRIGALGTSKSLATLLSPEVRQVLIDPDGAWSDPQRAAAWLIQADAEATVGALATEVPPRKDSTWREDWQWGERLAREAMDGLLDAEDAPCEPRTARDVAAAVPAGGTLVVASSMPVRDLEWFMAPRAAPVTVIAHRGASGIDGFVSSVLGVAQAGAGPVVALAGDLSMLHDQNGLLAVRSGAMDAVFVVINNDGGGIFSFLPQAEDPTHFEQLFGTPHGTSFSAVAELYGCAHQPVTRAGDLPRAVGEALGQGGVHLLEVRTDRGANQVMHRRLWEAARQALDSARRW